MQNLRKLAEIIFPYNFSHHIILVCTYTITLRVNIFTLSLKYLPRLWGSVWFKNKS